MVERIAVAVREGLGIAAVMARRDVSVQAIGVVLGAVPPDGPRAVVADGCVVMGVTARSWLVMREDAAASYAHDLTAALAALASVSDQSSAYVVLRLSGHGARTVLQRGAAIDFAAEGFPVDAVAVTAIAHIGVIIRRVDDVPTYDVAVFRSLAGSFRVWLDSAIAAL